MGFIPLIVYGLLSGETVQSIVIASAAALVTTLVLCFSDLKKRRILAWTTVFLFGGLILAVGVLGMIGIIPLTGILIYGILAAVSIGSIAAGIPFTLQYAREMVDRALWDKPGFIRVNYFMTSVWAGIFVVNLLLCGVTYANPGSMGWPASPWTYILLVCGILFTILYPGYVQRKHPLPELPAKGIHE